MNIVLLGAIACAIFAWGHFALERNVNRIARQLQAQVDSANRTIAAMQKAIDDLQQANRELERLARAE